MDPLTVRSRTRLNNGTEIPVLGLGVWQMAEGEETEQAVAHALALGYRHFDTAKLYANEASVGRAIRQSGVPREEVFVTTKLWPTDAFDADAAFEISLKKLDLGYVDLYLVHWPVPLLGTRLWARMERLYEQKLARAVGVSNYSVTQLEDVLRHANVAPAVNQIEFNPFTYERDMLAFCAQFGIVVEAYSPLTRGVQLDDQTIATIAARYGKSPAQVMLRWALEKGTVVIPKASRAEHLKENAAIFDFALSEEDLRRLDRLT